MRIGEIVGGAALVGVAVLVGIALADDPTPASNTADTSPFVFASSTLPTATSAPGATSTTPSRTTTSAPAVVRTTVERSTTPATTQAPAPALIPPEQRAGIAVRVLNGGAPTASAKAMTDVLRYTGFAPPGPANASRQVPATTVIFAPGREREAATVNDVVRARPENVVPAAADDPNWTAFGNGLSVLVVLGPAGT